MEFALLSELKQVALDDFRNKQGHLFTMEMKAALCAHLTREVAQE